ncbi:hypothetical protein LINPERHAP1_LOCUS24879 [Linum perenne]
MDGHDGDDVKQSTADMTAFSWIAEFSFCFFAGAKLASADAIQIPDNVRLHHHKEYPYLNFHSSFLISENLNEY